MKEQMAIKLPSYLRRHLSAARCLWRGMDYYLADLLTLLSGRSAYTLVRAHRRVDDNRSDQVLEPGISLLREFLGCPRLHHVQSEWEGSEGPDLFEVGELRRLLSAFALEN